MKVKVCGIASYEDAVLVLDQGADALGFNFYPSSPRYIDPATARSIIRRIPPFVTAVGLFVNVADPVRLNETARFAGVHAVQLHGDESPEYCRSLGDWTIIKVVRVANSPIGGGLEDYPVQAFLLDVKDDVLFGGTGKTFDWALAHTIPRTRPIILAGGLRPDNVRNAIRAVKPYAVDVCSGVESMPGKKDAGKLIDFMREVRNAGSSFE